MAEPRKPDSRGLQFFDITDFSPGIYDASLVNRAISAQPGFGPGPYPAPPGAADANNTWGCMALPNGGLGPLPAMNSIVQSLSDIGIHPPTDPADAINIIALANSYVTIEDELVIGTTWTDSGVTTCDLFSFVFVAATLNAFHTETFNADPLNPVMCCYPFLETLTGYGPNPQQVMVMPVYSPAIGTTSDLQLYPNPSTPTVISQLTVTTDSGTGFGHQGRIVIAEPFLISWPHPNTHPPNDTISYTEPPQTVTWPHQKETFGPENPVGYGAINSVSAGELFLVKCRGGGLVIQGDLNNPTVTTLPGVQSTGAIYGHSGTDQNGMYYCSDANGAWLWSGGNASQKVSAQLDNNFYIPQNQIPGIYYQYYCQRWGDWMLFSNNWVLNSTTGGWWRLSNPNLYSWFWYVPGYDDKILYTCLAQVVNQDEQCLTRFDRTVPASTYNWQSLPMRLPSEDRLSDIREVVIRAYNSYADPAPQVAVSIVNPDGTTTALPTWVMDTGTGEPQMQRLNCSVKSESFAIALTPSGTNFAPIIESISIGYRSREHAEVL